jgi:hypothetical protein
MEAGSGSRGAGHQLSYAVPHTGSIADPRRYERSGSPLPRGSEIEHFSHAKGEAHAFLRHRVAVRTGHMGFLILADARASPATDSR